MYTILPSLQDVDVDKSQPLFCDTETDGLYGKVRLLQCYQAGWPYVILVEWPNPLELALFLQAYHTVWHNAHYDITTVQQQCGLPIEVKNFDDTFLLSRLAFPDLEAYSLDSVMCKVLKTNPYFDNKLYKEVLQKSAWGKAKLDKDQLLYAAIDVKYMPEIWEAVKHKLDEPSYVLDKSTAKSCMKFQWNGLPIDPERHNAKYLEVSNELAKIPMPINANSWQQVRKWLDVDQSDKKFLSDLAIRGNDKARAVLDVRSRNKLITFLKKYDIERLVGKFKPSARSGRLTSDDENLQQIPRALKCIFGYPEDADRILIYSDYAQLELRTICAILGVSIMEQMFRDDVDLHGYVASVLFGDNYTKADRQVTKTYNFNLLYGGSVGMVLSILITYGVLIEERLANRHKRKWLNLFKEIDKWQQEQISAWRKGKLGSTPFGREYKGKLMTDQMNIKNQGAGAEVAKLALHYFYPWLEKFNADNDTDVMLCNFIHDSYILDAPNDPAIYKVVAEELANCMQQAWFEMSKVYKVKDLPMPVNVRVGNNWGDIENDIFTWEFNLKGMEHYNATI